MGSPELVKTRAMRAVRGQPSAGWSGVHGNKPAAGGPLTWRRILARRFARRADRARDAHRFAKAATLYRQALWFDHGRVDLRVQLGHMLKELTRFGEAEAAYRQAASQSPADGDIQLQLGHLLKLLGRRDEAVTAYSEAHRLLRDRNTDVAAAELRGFGASPELNWANSIAGEKLVQEGDRLRDARHYAEAADAYGNALKLIPGRSDIRIQHGNMLKDAGRLADAEAVYRAALGEAPENADLHLQLGHLLKIQGRRNEALQAYGRAAELQPSLDAADTELFHAGYAPSQQEFFGRQMALGGVEALLAISNEVTRLQQAVARLAQALPDVSAQAAFPIAAYGRFREIFDVPTPPAVVEHRRYDIVLAADGVALETLYAQLTSLDRQTYRNWQLCVVGRDTAHRRIVERAAVSDPRITWIEVDARETPAATERRVALATAADSPAANSTAADWLILPEKGALWHRHALAWLAAVADQVAAGAFVTDSEQIADSSGPARRLAPQLRQTVDYDTLLEANPFGETVVVSRPVYAAIAGACLTEGSLTAARSSLLLGLAHRGTVGHIPLPLVAIRQEEARSYDAPESSGPIPQPEPAAQHRMAVAAHLAAVGLAARIQLGLPARPTSPLSVRWQPSDPQLPVQVIIPTRDNALDLRNFVQSLHERAAMSGSLHVLIVDNGGHDPDASRILTELAGRERVQVVRVDEPFNWSRLNNHAVSLTTAPLLVFANDDMVMLSDGWDGMLRGLLERDEVGAVGARLVYADDTMQHAGILLGWPTVDVHDGRYKSLFGFRAVPALAGDPGSRRGYRRVPRGAPHRV